MSAQVPALLKIVSDASSDPAAHSMSELNEDAEHIWTATQHSYCAHSTPLQVPAPSNSDSRGSVPAEHAAMLLKAEALQKAGATQHSAWPHSVPVQVPAVLKIVSEESDPAAHRAPVRNEEAEQI